MFCMHAINISTKYIIAMLENNGTIYEEHKRIMTGILREIQNWIVNEIWSIIPSDLIYVEDSTPTLAGLCVASGYNACLSMTISCKDY